MVSIRGRRRALQPPAVQPPAVQPPESASPIGQPRSTNADETHIVLHHPLGSQTEQPEQQPHPQRALTDSQDSEDHDKELYMAGVVVPQFLRQVKRTVSSREEYDAFLQVLIDFKRRLSWENEAYRRDLKADTIRRVEELLQNYPLLLARFREVLVDLVHCLTV